MALGEKSFFWDKPAGALTEDELAYYQYAAQDLASFFECLYTTGIAPQMAVTSPDDNPEDYIGSSLSVTAGTELQVIVSPGVAMIKGRGYIASLPVALEVFADKTTDIVLRMDLQRDKPEIYITAKQREPGAALENNISHESLLYELILATVTVPAASTEIKSEMIIDQRLNTTAHPSDGKPLAGLMRSIPEINTKEIWTAQQNLQSQVNNLWNAFLSDSQAEFTTWFNTVKNTLGEDSAGNLLNMIEGLYGGNVGKNLSGQSVEPASEYIVTAGVNAEIFNDYQDRTFSGNAILTGNIASGDYSHAEGIRTTASGQYSHAEGYETLADGDYSHAECSNTNSRGEYSHSEGIRTTAIGDYSHAEGINTTASGDGSHSEGRSSIADGAYSHAEGDGTKANGNFSHSEGGKNIADGAYSHAEGGQTNASGNYSHAEGHNTVSSGEYSHAEGHGTVSSGEFSHAEGNSTRADGVYSHAEGYGTIAKGNYSHAAGGGTIANSYQTVVGSYNIEREGKSGNQDYSASAALFIVGIGSSYTSKNALTVYADGSVKGVKSYTSSGADYAEFFEWLDGNPNHEDRRGKFVTLEGEKIKYANPGDFIVGVISAAPSVVGDDANEEWKDRFQTDVFGTPITEQRWCDKYTNNEGNLIEEDCTDTERRANYTDENGVKHEVIHYTAQRLNPDYDPTAKYVPRFLRNEWDCVGLVGKLVAVDDGTCQINGYCTAGQDGIATASDTGYRVMNRLDDTHIKIFICSRAS